MYQLATLGGPPAPREIRITDPEGLGQRYTFLSYGDKLHRMENYSSHLKMLIWRGLAEKPVDRPDLDVLHDNIRLALEYFQKQNEDGEQVAAVDEPREEGSAEHDGYNLADPGAAGTFQFRIYLVEYFHPSKLTTQARAQNAWFQADYAMTIGDLKHAICNDWLPHWGAYGMQEQHLFLRVTNDRNEDRLAVEDDMTLWNWGVRNMSVLYIDRLPGDFFVGAR